MTEENGKVWVLTCPCGWSRMVPRSTNTNRRRKILILHREEKHPGQEATGAVG